MQVREKFSFLKTGRETGPPWQMAYGSYGNYQLDDPQNGMTDMINMMTARERGCMQGRSDAGNPSGVGVFCAAEVNLVQEYGIKKRVVDRVLPNINPPMDMVTYSSYEANIWTRNINGNIYCDNCTNGSQQQQQSAVASAMSNALGIIDRFAPDPMGLGKRRIIISEYGMFENQHPAGDGVWRTTAVNQNAKNFGISATSLWQLYDNQCNNYMSEVAGINTSNGQPAAMPTTNSECDGLWLKRVDGSPSPILGALQSFF